eukprot:scaffold76042_cov54-Cyclotella_meneghiniana.AAC.2
MAATLNRAQEFGVTFQMSSRTPVPQNLTRRPHPHPSTNASPHHHPSTNSSPSPSPINHNYLCTHCITSAGHHTTPHCQSHLFSIVTMNADNILHIAATENHWSITDFTVNLYTSPNEWTSGQQIHRNEKEIYHHPAHQF